MKIYRDNYIRPLTNQGDIFAFYKTVRLTQNVVISLADHKFGIYIMLLTVMN